MRLMNSILLQSRTRRRKQRIRRILFRVLTPVLLIVVIVGTIFFLPKFKVQKFEITGTAEVSREALEEIARASVSSRLFGIFPKDRVFFVPTNEIQNRILEAYPRIQDVSVVHNFPDVLSITIKEREVWAVYCARDAENSNMPASEIDIYEVVTGSCRLIDTKGVGFAEAPDLRGSLLLRIYGPVSKEFTDGQPIYDIEPLKKIQVFLEGLKIKLSLQIQEVKLGSPYDESVTFTTTSGWNILMDQKTDSELAVQNLVLVLGKHVTDQAQLEYVDLRFPNKVFYKLR